MATSKPGPIREVVESGGEPHYAPIETRYEPVGNGNLQGYAYELRHGKLQLLFTFTVAAADLAKMARHALQAAADAHNLEQWETDATAH